jgi:DNA-binding MarR family transcriptional regulator/GNAT superfamily N-acetyltransferase
MANDVQSAQVSAVRRFNRFYTQQLGVLDQIVLDSPFSLTEARVLYELAQHRTSAAKDVAAKLGIDAGYLSRTIQNFSDKGLVTRHPLPTDRRQYELSLTAKGRLAFGRLDQKSQAEIGAMLGRIGDASAARVVAAMTTIERTLGAEAPRPQAVLRGLRPGDIGWVIQTHGGIYASDYGFDSSFEALVADIAGQFLKSHDEARERCWIADLDGVPVGSVFLMQQSREFAKLRLLIVDHAGRGHRLGPRLVAETIGFARQCGYRKISLWTQSMLLAARKIYEDAGFVLIASEPHRSFGQDLIGETWELEL